MRAKTMQPLITSAIALASGFAMPAFCADQNIKPVDDTIKTTEYADGSGFKVQGGGATFTFDYQTKLLTMTNGKMHLEATFSTPKND
jgi:hypothetical protein